MCLCVYVCVDVCVCMCVCVCGLGARWAVLLSRTITNVHSHYHSDERGVNWVIYPHLFSLVCLWPGKGMLGNPGDFFSVN